MSVVRINAITVPAERADELLERFANRAGEVSKMPGFEAFELLRSAARNSRREVKAIAQELGMSRKTPAEIAELLPSSDVDDAGA